MGDASMPGGFFLVDLGNSIMFAALKETNCSHPMVLDRYLKIESDLSFTMAIQKLKLRLKLVDHICKEKISSISDICNVLAFLSCYQDDNAQETLQDIIYNFVDQVASLETNETIARKMSFLSEQLLLLSHSRPTFSKELIVMASLWRAQSTALYKTLVHEDVLILPSISTILRLSQPLHVGTGLCSSTKALLPVLL